MFPHGARIQWQMQDFKEGVLTSQGECRPIICPIENEENWAEGECTSPAQPRSDINW